MTKFATTVMSVEEVPGVLAKAWRICREGRPGMRIESGIFGADMKVSLTNDGPFTIILDSSEL